jgi:eukaryotic-like serine/threonine-protein kinase
MPPTSPESHDPPPDLDPTLDASTLSIRSPGRTAPHSPSQPPQSIGDYVIIGKLGEGGMGVVYEAQQQHPKRRVALKVVRGGHFVSENEIKMFEREAETLARLKHPNIAAIYESGRTEEGQHFFAMELVRGETLDAYAKRRASAGVRERLGLFRTICDAVNYAHQRGVIHRDLKPSNIVVVQEEGAARRSDTDLGSSAKHVPAVKILDFGLARITDSDAAVSIVTEVGAIKGTLPYMSPEQARGNPEEIDLRTDVYALGVVLYQLLAGNLPYDTNKSSILEAVRVICEDQPRSMRSDAGAQRIDSDVETIVLKALEKEPVRRYQNAAALADDIQRYLTSQPILARPPSTVYQMRKLVARHRVLVGAVAAIFVVLVALAATMTVQSARIAKERNRARDEAAKATAINDFLQTTLGAADPWSGEGRRVTLVEALDSAVEKIGTSFNDQPLIDAAVRHTIGRTYLSLGSFDRAEPLLRKSLEIWTSLLGRQSDDVAECLMDLARAARKQGNVQPSVEMARESLAIRRSLHGERSGFLAEGMAEAAEILDAAGQYDEAESLITEALQVQRELFGERSKEVASSLPILGSLVARLGRFREAESLATVALPLRREIFGERSPEVPLSMNDIATYQMALGKYAEAESMLYASMEITRDVLGEDSPEMVALKENLANDFFKQGRFDESIDLVQEVISIRRKVLGEQSTGVARSTANLAAVYKSAGMLDRSEETYRDAVDRLKRTLGPNHAEVASVLAGFAGLLQMKGDLGGAERALREALEIRRAAFEHDSPWIATTRVDLGVVLVAERQYVEAESLLVSGRDVREAAYGREDARVVKATKALVDLYEARGDREKAAENRARLATTSAAGK